ncbi:MAG: hypothetical protein KBC38_03900 [Candidatus Pacebacteria bacterium]|nr:hypothetical protein [Candidatus Paceibacterota bacterium]MBP9840690.1 hypothetical protein [Candidatus Paceibacterota bacterium]
MTTPGFVFLFGLLLVGSFFAYAASRGLFKENGLEHFLAHITLEEFERFRVARSALLFGLFLLLASAAL